MGQIKKLAVFCDGTWNTLRSPDSTNVVKLASCVADRGFGGEQQIVFYDEGVGVPLGISRVADALTKWIGGATGRGLYQKVEEAYRFVSLNYCPGDEIYVFGFSRGAHTARSLCGLISKCGILKRDCLAKIPTAFEHFRDSKLTKDSPDLVRFREAYAHEMLTSSDDRRPNSNAPPESRADLYQYRSDQAYRMMYAGVWDTVGAMGIPKRIDWFGVNKKYRFLDRDASSLIASIRHAVAANEQRGPFDATLYRNFDDLNAQWANATGYSLRQGDRRFVPYALRPYQERWFPGDHGSVGGGNPERKLSSGALLWIAQGAEWAGLRLDWSRSDLKHALHDFDPLGPLGSNGSTKIPKGEFRKEGPASADEIADPTHVRFNTAGDYRPDNLEPFLSAIPFPRAADNPPPDFPPPPVP